MGAVLKVQVLSVPTRLEVELSSQAVHAIGPVNVMGLWNIVSFVDASETYSVGYWPDVVVCRCRGVVMPKL